MEMEQKLPLIFFVSIGLVVLSIVVSAYSFEIITFSNATQKMVSNDFNCELEFTKTPEWDVNYSGYWNCQELQERMK